MKVSMAQIDFFNETFRLAVEVEHYENGRLAIELIVTDREGEQYLEPFGMLTANVVDQECPEGEVFIRDWGTNEGWALQFAVDNQIIEPSATGVYPTGYVNVKRYKLHPSFLEKIAKALVLSR